MAPFAGLVARFPKIGAGPLASAGSVTTWFICRGIYRWPGASRM